MKVDPPNLRRLPHRAWLVIMRWRAHASAKTDPSRSTLEDVKVIPLIGAVADAKGPPAFELRENLKPKANCGHDCDLGKGRVTIVCVDGRWEIRPSE